MPDESVLYDTPLEFVSAAIARPDECAAQSVIPRDDGSYACGCSCKRWDATAQRTDERNRSTVEADILIGDQQVGIERVQRT